MSKVKELFMTIEEFIFDAMQDGANTEESIVKEVADRLRSTAYFVSESMVRDVYRNIMTRHWDDMEMPSIEIH